MPGCKPALLWRSRWCVRCFINLIHFLLREATFRITACCASVPFRNDEVPLRSAFLDPCAGEVTPRQFSAKCLKESCIIPICDPVGDKNGLNHPHLDTTTAIRSFGEGTDKSKHRWSSHD